MKTVTLTLVTIIAEDVLAPQLVSLLRDAGATGHTLSPCSGEGSRGLRTGALPGGNLRLEAVVSDEVADVIVEQLTADYFTHYAVIAWLTPVSVVRGDKYVRAATITARGT